MACIRPGRTRPRVRAGWLLVPAALCCMMLPAQLLAQTLQGRVVEAAGDTPLAGAVVRLLTADGQALASAVTDAQGRFALSAGEAGEYRVAVAALGFAAATLGPVALAAAAPTTVLIRMAIEAVPIDALRVEVAARVPALERAGFYDRRRTSQGRFFERSDIEERNPRRIADMLRGIAGVRVIESGHNADVLLRAGGGMSMGGMCAPEVWLDGQLVSRGGGPGAGRHNLNEIRPTDLEAIEVYASAARVPARYGGAHAACGVVVFWSKQ
jgi:hypothetical protein